MCSKGGSSCVPISELRPEGEGGVVKTVADQFVEILAAAGVKRIYGDGPVLVDAVVNRTELAMPPSITMEMAKGFTLYMVKAVMSGRADEVIDLARTNLWH